MINVAQQHVLIDHLQSDILCCMLEGCKNVKLKSWKDQMTLLTGMCASQGSLQGLEKTPQAEGGALAK